MIETQSLVTAILTFIGGGLIGSLITAFSDGRLNRKILREQQLAEQRLVVAKILSEYQRCVNTVAGIEIRENRDGQAFIFDRLGFVQSAMKALDLFPGMNLTVWDGKTRSALVDFLRKLGLVIGDYVVPAAEVFATDSSEENGRRLRLLKKEAAELNIYYEHALDMANEELGQKYPSSFWFFWKRVRTTPELSVSPLLAESRRRDKKRSEELREKVNRRFDPDFR